MSSWDDGYFSVRTRYLQCCWNLNTAKMRLKTLFHSSDDLASTICVCFLFQNEQWLRNTQKCSMHLLNWSVWNGKKEVKTRFQFSFLQVLLLMRAAANSMNHNFFFRCLSPSLSQWALQSKLWTRLHDSYTLCRDKHGRCQKKVTIPKFFPFLLSSMSILLTHYKIKALQLITSKKNC